MASELKVDTIKDSGGSRILASDSGSAWSWGSGVPSGTVLQIVGDEDNTVTTPSNTGAVSIVSKAITTKRAGSHFLLLGQTNFGREADTPNVRCYFRRCLPGVAFASGNDLGAFTDGAREGGIGGAELRTSTEELMNVSIDWIDSSASYSAGDVITYHFVIGVRDVGIVVNRTGAADNYNYITRTYTTIRILEIGQ